MLVTALKHVSLYYEKPVSRVTIDDVLSERIRLDFACKLLWFCLFVYYIYILSFHAQCSQLKAPYIKIS